jgi:hypothetical protein
MNVSEQYENGKWVPSYYGLVFTVAQKRAGMSTRTEQDLIVRVKTLAEAQQICEQRNQPKI